MYVLDGWMDVYSHQSLFLLLPLAQHKPHTCMYIHTHTTGVIVGYVGGSHIPPGKKESHAHMLMSGRHAHLGERVCFRLWKIAMGWGPACV